MARLEQRPGGKLYSLAAPETNLLKYIQQQHQQVFAALLSNIVVSRLGGHVTENTQIRLSEDFTQLEVLDESDSPEGGQGPAKSSGPPAIRVSE